VVAFLLMVATVASAQPKDILFVTSQGLAQVNPDGTGLTILNLQGKAPHWSPDGTKFAFLKLTGVFQFTLFVADADGSNVRTLNANVGWTTYQWSPDATQIAFLSNGDPSTGFELFVVNADGTNLRSLGVRVGVGISDFGNPFVWTPDGSQILFVAPSGQLSYVRVSDGTVTNLPVRGAGLAYHPSGSFFVLTSQRSNNSPLELFVASPDGATVRPLNLQGENPILSPNGQFLLFFSSGSQPQAFVVELSPTGTPVGDPVPLNVSNLSVSGSFEPWSPDSTRLVLPTESGLFVVRRDGTGLTPLNASGFDPQWRPLPRLPFTVTIPAGLSLVGLPFIPTNPTRTGLGLAAGTRVAVYDPTVSGNYRIDDAAEPLPIAEGKAFWVKSANPQSPQVAGTPFSFPVTVSLQQGWNAIGNPLPTSLAWRFTAPSNLRIRQGAQEFTIEDAIRKGLISPFVWVWNETASRYELVYDATILPAQSGDPFRNDIPAFRGFWLFAKTSGLQLVIDSAPRSAVLASRSAPVKSDGFALALTVRKGGQVIGEGMVAVRPNVPSRLTIAPPPPAPDRHANALSLDDGNVVDVRPLGQSRYLWTVQVQDGDELSWHGTIPRGWQITLMDTATGTQISVRHLSRYQVSGRRSLLLIAQRDTNQPLRIVNLQTQGTRGRGVRISFGLTAPAQVKAVITTLTGRIIRVLDGGSRMAGTHQLFWRGETDGGHPAPVGVYLLRLQATDETGRQTQAVRTVMWR
jgi:Tol biopolymer transport system component